MPKTHGLGKVEHRASKQKIALQCHFFPYPSVSTYVVGTQKNRVDETVFKYLQHMFWLRNKKNDFQLPTLIWGPG